MIIKSHIRGGYRSAAEYMKDQGLNEKIRLVELSDPKATDLDDAFKRMWEVAYPSHCKKPLHHISINPMKGERLTDAQVLAIVRRCEEKYGYKMFHHQRVIVEHVKDGRQHFHVIWNRVSLYTGRAVWPGHHWKKSKQVCREMEVELGLMKPMPKRARNARAYNKYKGTGSSTLKLKHSQVRGEQKYRSKASALKATAFKSIKPKLANPIRFKPATEKQPPSSVPFRPVQARKGWPPAAVADWESWGHRSPGRFFALWPELS